MKLFRLVLAVVAALLLGGIGMGDTAALTAAKKAKKDEFYTQRVDIENELRHYKEHFRNKVVLCNSSADRERQANLAFSAHTHPPEE